MKAPLVWAVDQANDLSVWHVARLALTRVTFAPQLVVVQHFDRILKRMVATQ